MSKERGDDRAALRLRMPEQLRRKLAEAAHENFRSLNSEILHRLRTSLERQVRKAP